MKRIVILCDGTWNTADSNTPTNVVRLAQTLESTDPSGVVQVPIYVEGVGAGGGVTRFSRRVDSLLGGALGWGLLRNVVNGYRHLVFMYEPGDEVFVFGFSRGAYTARSLTGLIRSTGIIDRDALHRLPEAVRRYRTMDDPSTHPASLASHDFRAHISPRVVTSAAERKWRRENGLPEAPLFQIAYLGVWDSVGALGVPAQVPVLGHWTARRYRFHDADLSSMVRSARHAVALDERRRAYEPTRWSNVGRLNARQKAQATPAYQERFFIGDHGSVGGGGDITALSSISLRWVLEGAQEVGLAFDPDRLGGLRAEEDPTGPLQNKSEPPKGLVNWLTRLRPRDREGPSEIGELHPSVLTRWSLEANEAGRQAYRPGSLVTVHDQLLARSEERTDAKKTSGSLSRPLEDSALDAVGGT